MEANKNDFPNWASPTRNEWDEVRPKQKYKRFKGIVFSYTVPSRTVKRFSGPYVCIHEFMYICICVASWTHLWSRWAFIPSVARSPSPARFALENNTTVNETLLKHFSRNSHIKEPQQKKKKNWQKTPKTLTTTNPPHAQAVFILFTLYTTAPMSLWHQQTVKIQWLAKKEHGWKCLKKKDKNRFLLPSLADSFKDCWISPEDQQS